MSLNRRLPWICALAFLCTAIGSSLQAQQTPPGYAMPGLFPLYAAPPFQFRGNRILFITAKTTPDVLREIVPAPLVPNPANVVVVYVGSLNIGKELAGAFNYLESGILVPVVFPGTKAAGNYAVCLYLNKTAPIVGGREIWGYPKKDAEITFTEADGEIRGRVERSGTVLIRVSAKRQQKVDPPAGGPPVPFFAQKIIPSPRRDAPPEVWELVSSPIVGLKTEELWTCAAQLQLGSGAGDPLGRIKILEVVGAEFRVNDFVMESGEVLHDYLAKKQP